MSVEAYEIVVGGVAPGGAFAQNVFHYQVDEIGGDPFATASDLLDNFETDIIPSLADCIAQNCKLNLFHSKRVSGSGGPTVFKVLDQAGTFSSDSISNVFAADMAWYPGGALNRPGHIYLWGLPYGSIDAEVWQSAYIAKVAALAVALTTGLTADVTYTSASYGTYTKKTKTVTPADNYVLKPKPTGMNKRTLPVT